MGRVLECVTVTHALQSRFLDSEGLSLRVPFMEIVLMRARYGGVLLTVPAPANAGTCIWGPCTAFLYQTMSRISIQIFNVQRSTTTTPSHRSTVVRTSDCRHVSCGEPDVVPTLPAHLGRPASPDQCDEQLKLCEGAENLDI